MDHSKTPKDSKAILRIVPAVHGFLTNGKIHTETSVSEVSIPAETLRTGVDHLRNLDDDAIELWQRIDAWKNIETFI